MKAFIATLVFSALTLTSAYADFQLSQNNKAVVCYAEDNQSLLLDANRSEIEFEIEGESMGAQPIVNVLTDKQTYITYITSEVTLTLSDAGDTFQYNDDEGAYEVRCK